LALLLAARIGGELMERFGQLAIAGEIAAGIVLGPSILNLVPASPELKVVSELGVFLLVMLAGMELDFADIADGFRGRGSFISIAGFVLPFGAGMGAGAALGYPFATTIFLGLSIAITALPVSVRILMDLGKLQSDTGQRIVAAAVFNDIAALLLLGVALGAQRTGSVGGPLAMAGLKSVSFLGAVFLVHRLVRGSQGYVPRSRRVVAWLQKRLRARESLFSLTLLFVLGFASLSEAIGLHFVVGAFFGAMVLSRRVLGRANFDEVRKTASGITMGFLAPIFFAAIGLEFRLGSLANGVSVAVILAVAFASKLIGGYLGSRLAGLDSKRAWIIGLGLNGRGIMELVIADLGLRTGFIDEALFSTLVLMGVITTMLTPVLLRRAYSRNEPLEQQASQVTAA
jgi:Kef-type K+ transport system membrane component KefB